MIAILTEINDPKQYIKRIRQRDEELSQGWIQNLHLFNSSAFSHTKKASLDRLALSNIV
jgi:hypothetical protein